MRSLLSGVVSAVFMSAAMAAPIPAAVPQPAGVVDQMLSAAAARSDSQIDALKAQSPGKPRIAPADEAAAQRLHESAAAAAKAGNVEQALRLWTEAQKADPGNARYPSNIASMYLKMHRQNDAVAAARQALELDPAKATAWIALGNAYAATGKVAEAAASFYLALHYADKPDVYRDQFRALASRPKGTSDLVDAAHIVLDRRTQGERDAEFNAVDANGVKPAPDIGGFRSLRLPSSQRFDLSKPGTNKDALYKSAEQSYVDGYMSKQERTYYQNAVWMSAKSAFLGHPEAPGLLGIVLAEGYTTIAGTKAAPDFDEARKLSALSVARGGTMGYVGLGDLALFGKGEAADAHKGIQLYGKAAARNNELAARRLVDVTLNTKDRKIIGEANAALAQAKVPEGFIAGYVNFRTQGNAEFAAFACGLLQDDVANALRQGDRERVSGLRQLMKQFHCKG